MTCKVTDLIDKAAFEVPNKVVFEEADRTITYVEFKEQAYRVATYLIDNKIKGEVAVFIGKSIDCLIASFGALYAGCSYCVIDTNSPENRLRSIIGTLRPASIITTKKLESKLTTDEFEIIEIENLKGYSTNYDKIIETLNSIVDTDPAYVLFTSGSTGKPKGTVVSHRAIISYVSSVESVFGFKSDVRFGSQTPFYFSMSILDIYVTILTMGTLIIIPKMLFSFPVRLIEYMQNKRINTIYWVPTAYGIIASRKTFSETVPSLLQNIMFAGEVMPVKYLNYWKQYLPNRLYANLFGPTEVTDTCTYYIVDREYSIDDTLPIGNSFPNSKVILLDDDDRIVTKVNTDGELCVGGSFLANGYLSDNARTEKVFCQNPANLLYPEIIYRTGDIAYYDKNGIIMYKGRKDNQIKHMGYRIELGEIETIVGNIEGIDICACIYNDVGVKSIWLTP